MTRFGRTSSSVVQVLTSGYGFAGGADGGASVLAGQRGTGSGVILSADGLIIVFNQLKKDGHVHHAQIGIAARTITEPLAEALGLEPYRGALVEDLIPEGPAAKAGVQIGDVVESVGDKQIRDVRDLASSSYG